MPQISVSTNKQPPVSTKIRFFLSECSVLTEAQQSDKGWANVSGDKLKFVFKSEETLYGGKPKYTHFVTTGTDYGFEGANLTKLLDTILIDYDGDEKRRIIENNEFIGWKWDFVFKNYKKKLGGGDGVMIVRADRVIEEESKSVDKKQQPLKLVQGNNSDDGQKELPDYDS